jgi:threonyl-tRNA synthetase
MEEKVAIRRQGKGDAGVKSVAEFIADAVAEIKEKRAEQ